MIERLFLCPRREAIVTVGSELDSIFMARRTCETCNQESLIVDDVPIKPRDYRNGAAPASANT